MAAMKGGIENPFRQPSDEEVFFMRDQERLDKEKQKAKLQYQRVHEKTTASARIGSATKSVTNGIGDTGEEPIQTKIKKHGFLPDLIHTTEAQKEKENMADFIAKKREMGLIRMSLATKRAEIHKLETEAERTEKRIKQQEEQLEETSQKFDHFLKDNDMKAVEAMKKAETESKGKNEKTGEIKKLTAHNAAVMTEKTKYEEQLNACLRYKHDLDRLTPDSWFRETLVSIKVRDERERLREEALRELEGQSQGEDGDDEEVKADDIDDKIDTQMKEFTTKSIEKVSDMSMSSENDETSVKGFLDAMDPDKVFHIYLCFI